MITVRLGCPRSGENTRSAVRPMRKTVIHKRSGDPVKNSVRYPIIIMTLVNPWYQTRGISPVCAGFGEARGQTQFLVVHPPQLNGDVCRKQKGSPHRGKLYEYTKDRNFFGEIERVPHKTIGTGSDEVPCLCHQAERAAKL